MSQKNLMCNSVFATSHVVPTVDVQQEKSIAVFNVQTATRFTDSRHKHLQVDGMQFHLVSRHEGRPLLVVEDTARAVTPRTDVAIDGLEDPKQGEEGECQGGPMNEGVMLV